MSLWKGHLSRDRKFEREKTEGGKFERNIEKIKEKEANQKENSQNGQKNGKDK